MATNDSIANSSGANISGLRIGAYEIVRGIGEGGMAQVYLAKKRGAGGFEKTVVLKVLHSRLLSNEMVVRMFLEEARVLARLQHPNIVSVFEVECVGGVPFLAMEHVRGPTLGDLQRFVGRPPRDQVGLFLILVQQVCHALHYAHTLTVDGRPLGLVHRDVSGTNILVDAATGAPKLIDFGIAKAQDSSQQTDAGILKGKISFMAPELLEGVRPTPQSDVYSLGVLLYQILFARKPFRDTDLIASERASPYLPCSELVYPPGLGDVVARAMAPSPKERYRTAAELAEALGPLIAATEASVAGIPPLVQRVFPRGEADWQLPRASTSLEHRALAQIVADRASVESLVPAKTSPIEQNLAFFASLTALGAVLLGAAALALAGFGRGPDRSVEASALLDAADQLLLSHNPAAASSANEQAARLHPVDPEIESRAREQRTRIDHELEEAP